MDALLGAFFGTLFGALISLIAYSYKVRQDKKEKLNKALFSLLKISGQLVYKKGFLAINLHNIIHEIFVLKSIEIDEVIIEEKEEAVLKQILNTFSPSSEYDLKNVYQEALSDIASFDPLLALQLDSIQNLSKVINILDDYVYSEGMDRKSELLQNEDMLLSFAGTVMILSEGVLSKGKQKDVEKILLPLISEEYFEKISKEIDTEIRSKITLVVEELEADDKNN